MRTASGTCFKEVVIYFLPLLTSSAYWLKEVLISNETISSPKPDQVVLWRKPDHMQFVCLYFENLTGPAMFLIGTLAMAELFSRVNKARCDGDMADWRVFHTVWREIVWNRKAAYPVEFLER